MKLEKGKPIINEPFWEHPNDMKEFDFDMDAFIQCAIEHGAIISKTPEGKESGIYVNGKPFTAEDFMSCFEEGPEDEQKIC